MRIAILGTGTVGQTVAGRLVELGHDVTVGTRDIDATMTRTEPDGMGNPPYPVWALPPTLFVKDTDSLAEQIQREFPGAKVVRRSTP